MKQNKFTLRIVTITLILLISCASHVKAFDLDETVDDDIRKNYNSSKLIKDTNTEYYEALPDLPKNLQVDVGSNKKEKGYSAPPLKKLTPFNNTKISKGTSFDVVNIGKISDWQTKGTTVKFKTTSAISKKGYTLPTSTVFLGEIVESHQPQISCNGGLVVIKIKSMVYKGSSIPVNAYVTRANGKIIFLNNIKGDRTYLKTVWKKGNWGRALFGRMLSLTINLGGDGSTFILSPFPLLYGTLCFSANTLISPITAFFAKGKHIVINSGSRFRIKLTEDSYID